LLTTNAGYPVNVLNSYYSGVFTGDGSGLTNITSLSTITGIHYVSSLTFSYILTGYMLGTNALNQPVMWAVSTNIISY